MNNPNQKPCEGAVAELLPWYVNDTLDDSEREVVRAHIEFCEDCRQNVAFLSRLQHAVKTESPSPLVPPTRGDLLRVALDRSERREGLRHRWQWLAAAAALVLLTGTATILLVPGVRSVDSPTLYETATSSPTDNAINFVVELEFGADVSEPARSELFDAIDAMDTPIRIGEHSYRVTLAPGSLSLGDLEVYIESIRSRPEVTVARVVAVQLPVE